MIYRLHLVHFTARKYSSLARIPSDAEEATSSSSCVSNEETDRKQQAVSNVDTISGVSVVTLSEEGVNNVENQKTKHGENEDVKRKPE